MSLTDDWEQAKPDPSLQTAWDSAKPDETHQRSVGAELMRQAGLTARIIAKAIAAPGEMLGEAVGLDTSGAVNRLMTKAGVPTPETPTEKGVAAIGEGTVGAVLPMGAAKLAKPITEVGKGIKTALEASPIKQAVSGAAAGGAGQGAQAMGFGPTGQAVASLAAGALPFAVPMGGGIRAPKNLKEATFADARAHGYVATPTAVVESGPSNIMEGITSKQKLTAKTSSVNSAARANDIRQEFSLGEGDHITPQELDQVRENAYGAYKDLLGKLKQAKPHVTANGEVIPQGSIRPTPEFKKTIETIANEAVGLKDKYPELVDAPLRKVMDRKVARLVQYHDAEDAFNLLKTLREQASAHLSAPAGQRVDPKNRALGEFEYKAANAIEGLIEQSLKDPDALAAMRQARKTIAQTYDVQYALNPATGEVSGQRLAQKQRAGSPQTGALKRASDFYNSFKQDNRDMSRVGGTPSYNAWDFLVAGGAAMAGHPGVAIAELASRGLIPRALASQPYQNRILSGGDTGFPPALLNVLLDQTRRQ